MTVYRVYQQKTLLGLLSVTGVLMLGGCHVVESMTRINQTPPLTHPQNPESLPGYQPMDMPMPDPIPAPKRHINSLWQPGARSFFKDQRASRKGDLLTVTFNISENADMKNETSTDRNNTSSLTLLKVLGLESQFPSWFRSNPATGNVLNTSSHPTLKGKSESKRSETLNFTLSATIIQVLRNGHFVIQGRQELRVGDESREIIIKGVIRPQDITSTNRISHDKIAELRASYGGRGQLSDSQKTPWGAQMLNTLSPF